MHYVEMRQISRNIPRWNYLKISGSDGSGRRRLSTRGRDRANCSLRMLIMQMEQPGTENSRANALSSVENSIIHVLSIAKGA